MGFDLQTLCKLPLATGVFQVPLCRLMLDEDHRHRGISCFGRNTIDTGDHFGRLKCLAITFTKSLLNINDQ